MSLIILLHNRKTATSFLQQTPLLSRGEAGYLALQPVDADLERLLSRSAISPVSLADIDGSNQDRMLQDYLDAIGLMGKTNGRQLYWWATDLAAKTRFRSRMSTYINEIALCLLAIERTRHLKSPLVILFPSWPVVKALEKIAHESNWQLQVPNGFWHGILTPVRAELKTWFQLLEETAKFIIHIFEARLAFGKVPPRKDNQRPAYLIKSFIYESAFTHPGVYRDPFFGPLPDWLEAQKGGDQDIITIVLAFKRRFRCYRLLAGLKEKRIFPLPSFLRVADVIKALLSIAYNRMARSFKVPDRITFRGYKIAPLFKSSLRAGGWQVSIIQYLHYTAAMRIARYCNVVSCALTYEGNPWERMFIAGLRRFRADIKIFGYQHAVVPQAATSTFLSALELKHAPLPDNIITAGDVPADIIKRYSRYPPEQIRVGGALRIESSLETSRLARRGAKIPMQVLVVLEGVKEVLPLVRYVLANASTCPLARFTFRAHPVLPFERIASRLAYRPPRLRGVQVSTGKSLTEDLEACDVVLYWGTTVALQAILAGKPVIHFRQNDIFSFDPLFNLEAFKWTVDASTNLQVCLEAIRALADEDYYASQEKAAEYVRNYFHPVDTNALRLFLP